MSLPGRLNTSEGSAVCCLLSSASLACKMLECATVRVFILTATTILAIFGATSVKFPRFAPGKELRSMRFASRAADDVSWSVQTSGIDTNLRGISAANTVDANGANHITVWASGSNGVILFSSDLGKTWKRLHVTDGDSLDFRGIVAFDAKRAYVMSSGSGDKSRIYETKDSGESWKLEFTGKNPSLFLDALACDSQCYALSDPVDGKFLLLSDHNNGTWSELPADGMPAALPGEGAFAASGTSLALGTDGAMYFGTGGAKAARIFHSTDYGKTWNITDTPVAIGNASSGIFSVVCTPWGLVVVGGDYKDPRRPDRVAAYSRDEGQTWQLARQQPGGYRSGAAALYGSILAVGPTGEDISNDFGAHWKHVGLLDLNAVFVLDIHNGWAVGAKGTIVRLINHKQYFVQNNMGERNERDLSISPR
jgi:photosystem II stability/assembly factor-like uncharacterized protein